jgi:uncharacterized protein
LFGLLNSLPGTGHSFLVGDLSKKDGIHSIGDTFATTHYDVLINNVGIGIYGRFEDVPLSDTINMLQLNMYALTALCHIYLKTARKGDAIVNLSSTLGITSFPGLTAYTATKAYVENFSSNLWWENKNKGIYVLGFLPGATYTNFHETGGGDKSYFPTWIMQNPEQVAKELVRALEKRRKPRVVSGSTNRIMLFFQRFMSRAMVTKMMGSFSPLAKEQKNSNTGARVAM